MMERARQDHRPTGVAAPPKPRGVYVLYIGHKLSLFKQRYNYERF